MVKMDRHWVQLRGTCPMQLSKLQQQPQHPQRYCYTQARRLILSAIHNTLHSCAGVLVSFNHRESLVVSLWLCLARCDAISCIAVDAVC